MAMTKKDYEAIAVAIKIWTTEYVRRAESGTDLGTWETTAQKVAENQLSAVEFVAGSICAALAHTNPRFNKETFYKACAPERH